jgi:hypothetical protein
VLTNSGSARPGLLLDQVARAALGVPLLRGPVPVRLSAEFLARYAGTYALMLPDGARDFTFFVKDGQSMSQLQGQDPVPVISRQQHFWGGVRSERTDRVHDVRRSRRESVAAARRGDGGGARK